MKAKHSGAALIIVLFVVALAASLAVKMNARLMVEVQRSSNMLLLQQARWYAMAGETFAKQVLVESKKDQNDVVHLDQLWARDAATSPVDDGTISGEIRDLQSCLNLNALRASNGNNSDRQAFNPAHTSLVALLDLIEDLPITESKEALADSLYDWLDSDTMPKRQGVEEGEYMSYDIPYMTANHYLASSSELRLIFGFNPLLIDKLLPYVCVIPQRDLFQLNVNTVKTDNSALLAAMLNISQSNADNIIGQRPEKGWSQLNEFITVAKQNGAKLSDKNKENFTVNSNYFEVKTKASFFEANFAMKSIIHITDNQEVSVLARRFGGVQ